VEDEENATDGSFLYKNRLFSKGLLFFYLKKELVGKMEQPEYT